MNFLDLARRAAIECGVASGSAIVTALPTVTGATGSLGRICGWVADGWSDLAMAHDDWDFLRSANALGGGVTINTIAGQASYPLGTGPGTVGVTADAFGKWDRETFRCFPTLTGPNGEAYIDEIPFDDWRDAYYFGANRLVQTRPVAIAVGPDNSLCLGPPSNGLYTVTADYYRAPNELVLDTDVPFGLPARFHMCIVYQAMMKCGGYESAPELFQRGSQEYAVQFAQLEALRAPRMSFGGALA